jgi:hypothetical protein
MIQISIPQEKDHLAPNSAAGDGCGKWWSASEGGWSKIFSDIMIDRMYDNIQDAGHDA